jgi:hypothetical protein
LDKSTENDEDNYSLGLGSLGDTIFGGGLDPAQES